MTDGGARRTRELRLHAPFEPLGDDVLTALDREHADVARFLAGTR